MDSHRISSPAERDANVERLRSMTTTVLVAGTAAVVTFAVAAAITNPGHQSTATTGGSTSNQAGQSGTTSGSSSSQTGQSGTSSDQSTLNGSGSTSQSNSFFQQPAQAPGFFGGGGQTTTGGS